MWRSDKPPAERGFLALGTPIGTHEFVAAAAEARLGEAQRLLDEIAELPDLQSSWLLLLQCASPRANHLIRTPPSLSAGYARDHDAAIWRHGRSKRWRQQREWAPHRQNAHSPIFDKQQKKDLKKRCAKRWNSQTVFNIITDHAHGRQVLGCSGGPLRSRTSTGGRLRRGVPQAGHCLSVTPSQNCTRTFSISSCCCSGSSATFPYRYIIVRPEMS